MVQVRLLCLTLLIILERQVSLQEYGKAWIAGIKSMLVQLQSCSFAWTINKVVGDAQTGKYLSSLVSGSIPVQFLPVDFIYPWFSNGILNRTSWGTFGIMLPIAASNG
ncbi:MAG: Na+/H+ antiporter NhaC family protein [Haemophilus parainfluenzae]